MPSTVDSVAPSAPARPRAEPASAATPPEPRIWRVGLLGHGRVGRAVAESIAANGDAIARRHGVRFRIASILVRDAARRFVSSLRWFKLGESLGGVKSLVCHPASMTHASIPAEERRRSGLPDSLVRLSVGIEDVRDRVEDLGEALERVVTGRAGCARIAAT